MVVRQGGIQIGRPAGDVVGLGQGPEFVLASAGENGIDLDGCARGKRDSALFPDGENRADQVLVGTHAPGDAIEDDADCVHVN